MNLKTLKKLSKEDYDILKSLGMLWEFFPEATGDYKKDLDEETVDRPTERVDVQLP